MNDNQAATSRIEIVAVDAPSHSTASKSANAMGKSRDCSARCISRWLGAGVAVLLMVLWASVLAAIAADRSRTVAAAVKEVDNLARAFEQHVTALFDGLDHLMQHLIEDNVRRGEGLHARANGRPLALPGAVVDAWIIDRDGYLADSTGPFRRIWLGDRDYYKIHLASEGSSLFVGRPVVERISGKLTFHASRRISRSDGSFAGVLVMSLDPGHLADFYRTVDLGQRGLVELMGLDGVLRVRRSPGGLDKGFEVRDKTLFAQLASGSAGHGLDSTAPDGVRRYVSYRTMHDYPFMVQVGMAAEDVLSAFEKRRAFMLLGAAIATALLLAGAWWLMRMAAVQQRSTSALAESQARLQAFMNSVPDMAWMKDADGRFLAVNTAAAHWFGMKEEEIVGRTDAMLLPLSLASHFHDAAQRVVERGETVRFEASVERSGEVRWLETIKAPAHDARGRLCGACCISRDITERKNAEAALARANRALQNKTAVLTVANQDLQAFTSMVSHDLRAPARHVCGFSGLLRESLLQGLDDRAEKCLGKIEKAASGMSKLIEGLIAFSRGAQSRLTQEAVSLQELVVAIVEEAAPEMAQRNIAWRIAWLPAARGDRALLKLALANIIGNAVKYTRTRREASIEIGTIGCTADQCTVYVRDNGVGFDATQAERMFDVFERMHGGDFEGSGIGLATVKRIVERHGGRVWAEGKPGAGAAFYLALPAARSVEETRAAGPVSGACA